MTPEQVEQVRLAGKQLGPETCRNLIAVMRQENTECCECGWVAIVEEAILEGNNSVSPDRGL